MTIRDKAATNIHTFRFCPITMQAFINETFYSFSSNIPQLNCNVNQMVKNFSFCKNPVSRTNVTFEMLSTKHVDN